MCVFLKGWLSKAIYGFSHVRLTVCNELHDNQMELTLFDFESSYIAFFPLLASLTITPIDAVFD